MLDISFLDSIRCALFSLMFSVLALSTQEDSKERKMLKTFAYLWVVLAIVGLIIEKFQ